MEKCTTKVCLPPDLLAIPGLRSRQRNCSIGAARRLGLDRPLGPKRPFTSPLGLAARRVGGKSKFIDLCRLSSDGRVQALVRRWDNLSSSDRRYISMDDLAEASGLQPEELFGAVVSAAFAAGLDVEPLLTACFGYLQLIARITQEGLKPRGAGARLRVLALIEIHRRE
jgi:hypothetical protein